MREGVFSHRAHSFGHDASSPELFSEPVAYLSRAAKYIRLQKDAYAANRNVVYRYCKVIACRVRCRFLYPFISSGERVRMRKPITHIEPYLSIVGMTHERLFISASPVANAEMSEVQFHNSLSLLFEFVYIDRHGQRVSVFAQFVKQIVFDCAPGRRDINVK